MDWTRKCGCRGGDGGCSYSGAWADHCKDYPNCESGIEDARIELANREYNLPENVEKRKRDRKLKEARAAVTKAVKTAKELGVPVTELGIRAHTRGKCQVCGGSGFYYDDESKRRNKPCETCRSTGYNDGQCCNDDRGLCCGAD